MPRTRFESSSTRSFRSLKAFKARVPPGRSASRWIACSPLPARRAITSASVVSASLFVAMAQSYHAARPASGADADGSAVGDLVDEPLEDVVRDPQAAVRRGEADRPGLVRAVDRD